MKKIILTIIITLLIVLAGALGYMSYNLNKENTNYKKEIEDYKHQIQAAESTEQVTRPEKKETTAVDCAAAIKNNTYAVKGSGNAGANGGPATEETSMTFTDSKVNQVAGTGAWEENYSVNNNVITFDNSGSKTYGIISQDCTKIYTIDMQTNPNVKIYERK